MKYRIRAWLQLLLRPIITGAHSDRTFVLDHLRITNADFTNCTFYYGGSGGVTLLHVQMENPTFAFYGAASSTLNFLLALEKVDPRFIQKTFSKTFDAGVSK